MFKPFDFQEKDLKKLRDNNYTGLLAMEPGSGKTPTALFSVRDSGADQTLVIAPKNTFANAWNETSKKVLDTEARVVGNGNKKERQALADLEWGLPGVFLVSPQLFTRADISMWTPDMLIVDEVHQLNNANKKGQRKLSGYQVKDKPISRQSGMKLALSGTPARSSFERMWAVTRFLWPERMFQGDISYDNYYGWLNERMSSKKIVIGKDDFGNLKYAKEWLLEKDQGRLFQEMPCVLQHFRREECCEFHPNGFLLFDKPNEIKRIVELSSEQKRIIKELEKQGLAWIDDHPLVVDLPITLQQRIRQTCLAVPTLTESKELDKDGLPKTDVSFADDCKSSFIDETFNILEQLGDEPVLIFVSSQKFASVLTKRLNKAGITAFEYSGVTSKTRDRDKELFGTEFRVCVGQVTAVGTGLDGLQTVCKNEIWLEVPVDDIDTIQGSARLDRLGAIGQVQRFWVHDDLGYSRGMLGDKLAKRLEVAKSTRLAL